MKLEELEYAGRPIVFERLDTQQAADRLLEFLELATYELKHSKQTDFIEILNVAGEATHEEYRQAYEKFKFLLSSANLRIQMVAGPVLSGYDGNSILMDLAREYEDNFQLYVPYRRQSDHWKSISIDGDVKYLQIERPHEPVPPDYCYKVTMDENRCIYDPSLEVKPLVDHTHFFFNLAAEKRTSFQQLTERHCWKYKTGQKAPRVLPSKKIVEALERLKSHGLKYEEVSAEVIVQAAESPEQFERMIAARASRMFRRIDSPSDAELRMQGLEDTARWLQHLPPTLATKHQGEFIAAHEATILASSDSYGGLVEMLRDKGPESYVITYLQRLT